MTFIVPSDGILAKFLFSVLRRISHNLIVQMRRGLIDVDHQLGKQSISLSVGQCAEERGLRDNPHDLAILQHGEVVLWGKRTLALPDLRGLGRATG